MILAAKTTASGLIGLLIAFTFNLDQTQWALLTVVIVSQARQSGPVLAKSFYRSTPRSGRPANRTEARFPTICTAIP